MAGNSNRFLFMVLAVLILGMGLYSVNNIAGQNWRPVISIVLVMLAVIAVSMDLNTLLCIITVIAAFNFAPLLLNPMGPVEGVQPMYMLVLRDVLLVLLLAGWFVRRAVDKAPLRISLAVSGPLVVYCFYTLFSMVVRVGDHTELLNMVKSLRYLIIYPLVLTFVAPYSFRNRRDVMRFLWVFVIVGFAVAVIGLVEARTDFGDTYMRGTAASGEAYGTDGRMVSTLANPNNLSAYLGMVIGVALSLGIDGALKSRLQKLFILSLLGISAASLFLTFSRGGVLATTAAVAILLGLRGKNQRPKLLIAMVIVMLAGSVGFYQLMQDRRGSVLAGLQREPRVQHLNVGIRYMFSSPFEFAFGRLPGKAKFMDASTGMVYSEASDGLTKVSTGENFFVAIWMLGGAIGLFIFLFLLFAVLREIERVYRRQSDPYLRAGCSAALVSFLCVIMWGISAGSFALFPAGYYAWIFAGLAIGIGRIEETKTIHSVDSAGDLSSDENQLPGFSGGESEPKREP